MRLLASDTIRPSTATRSVHAGQAQLQGVTLRGVVRKRGKMKTDQSRGEMAAKAMHSRIGHADDTLLIAGEYTTGKVLKQAFRIEMLRLHALPPRNGSRQNTSPYQRKTNRKSLHRPNRLMAGTEDSSPRGGNTCPVEDRQSVYNASSYTKNNEKKNRKILKNENFFN